MTPRIYVADLAAYNAGQLVGQWIDLEDGSDLDHDDFVEWINAVVQGEILRPGHEEWAIHDYEGFGTIKIDEYDSFDTIVNHVQRMGDESGKYFAWISNSPGDADNFDPDKVDGPYESVEQWFDQYIDSYWGSLDLEEILANNGVDKRVAAGLAEMLTFITAEQFQLIMSCNAGVSFIDIPTGEYSREYYAVDMS